jgi:hypothetical protein
MSYTEPDPADVVALLRAHLAGDEQALEGLFSTVDLRALFAMTVGFLIQALHDAGVDAEQLDTALARTQQARRGG